MRKVRAICAVVLSAIFVLTSTINTSFAGETTRQAEKHFSHLVEGLKKFNAPPKNGYTVATFVGSSQYPCRDETELFIHEEWRLSERCSVAHLNLLTIDGEYLSVKKTGNELEMSLLFHALMRGSTTDGTWFPVLSVPLSVVKKDGKPMPMVGERFLGRFWYEKKECSFQEYEEERYE